MERFQAWCETADVVSIELSGAIRTVFWEKYAFICAQGGMTASVRLPLGEIRNQEASWVVYRRISEEVCDVGRATGIDRSDDTFDRWMDFAADLRVDPYSSLHYQMTHEKPVERWYAGGGSTTLLSR